MITFTKPQAILRKVDLKLLRRQLSWLYKQDECDEKEGITNLLENILDQAEGVTKE